MRSCDRQVTLMPCADIFEVSEPAGGEIWQIVDSAWLRRRRDCLTSYGGKPAKRRLFGNCSPHEVRDYVKKELAIIHEQDRANYNFDFERMTPLPGRYQWQPVESSVHLSPTSPLSTDSSLSSSSDFDRSRLSSAPCSTPSRARRRIRLDSSQRRCRCIDSDIEVRVGPCHGGNGRCCRACGTFLYKVCDAQTSPGLSIPHWAASECRSDRLLTSPRDRSPSSLKDSIRRDFDLSDPTRGLSHFAQQMKITDFFRSRKRSSPGNECTKLTARQTSPPSSELIHPPAAHLPPATFSFTPAINTPSNYQRTS